MPHSILSIAVPKPKVYFVQEIISTNDPQPEDLESLDDVMPMSESSELFFTNISAVFNDDKINGRVNFCVWTQHGFVLDKVSFDPVLWNIKGLFFQFHKLYVASVC